MLSDGDRMYLDNKFDQLHERINKEGSRIHKLDIRTSALEAGSTNACDEAVNKHIKDSAAHNPVKLGRNIVLVSAVLGALAKCIHWLTTYEPPKPH